MFLVLMGCFLGITVEKGFGLPSYAKSPLTHGKIIVKSGHREIKCDVGYSLQHAGLICSNLPLTSCHQEPAKCIATTCGAPSRSHGTIHCSSPHHQYKSTCKLTCSTGYRASNSHTTTTCLSTGKWSTLATCQEKECQPPPKVQNGRYVCPHNSTHKPHDICDLICDYGFKPDSLIRHTECLTTAAWTPSATCREILCPNPPLISSGKYSCSNRSTNRMDDTCDLHCDAGYKPDSNIQYIRCLSSSTWSKSALCQTKSFACEVCSGPLCGIIPNNDSLVTCPGDKPYCMNHVDNKSDGTKNITKTCASALECNTKWWHGTSDKINCVDLDPTKIYNNNLSCYYCCTEDGCNTDVVPDQKTLFIGHD